VRLSLYVHSAVNCKDEPAVTIFVEAVMLIDNKVGEGEVCDFEMT